MALSEARESVYKRNHRRRYPDRERSRNLTSKALLSGKLILQGCSVVGCKRNKIEAHHPAYDSPLEVIPLCRHHHLKLHRNWVLR